ncbi:MAG: hypothetical protein R2706_01210 [Acidimicrobiales bacterium]
MKKQQLAMVVVGLLVGGVGCGSGPSVEAFCAQYEKIDELTAVQIDTSDPDALEGYFTDTEAAFGDLVVAAPDDIKPDTQTLDQAFGDIMAALRAIDFDPAAIDPSIFEIATADEANNRVDSYYSANCAAIE